MRRLVPQCVLAAVFLIFISLPSHAQYLSKGKKPLKHRFNAGIIVGPSLSQIDGDHFHGFHKRGIRAGIKGMAYLTKRLDIVTALLYNQKGSLLEEKNIPSSKIINRNLIHLSYMEVPLLLSFRSFKNRNYGYRYEIGFSYARLAKSRIDEGYNTSHTKRSTDYNLLEQKFQTHEFNFVGGISYFINSQIGIGFHYTVQFNKLYNKTNPLKQNTIQVQPLSRPTTTNNVSLLRNYQLGFYLTYHIF